MGPSILPGLPRPTEVFLSEFPEEKDNYLNDPLDEKWTRLLEVRSEMTKALEIARQDKVIGHSLEAAVTLSAEGDLADFIEENWQTLKDVAIVSSMDSSGSPAHDSYKSEELPGLSVTVNPAAGDKCERCWVREESVGQNEEHPQLCDRCASVVTAQ